jgi:pimeloyl-ACP methyl ester carboxylesterase
MRIALSELDTHHEEDGDGPPLVLLHPGLADLAAYSGRALVMVGDGDWEIPMAHTLALRDALRAQLAVVPGTGHGLFAEKPALCSRIVIDFLEEQP